jgi:hypothetical protein
MFAGAGAFDQDLSGWDFSTTATFWAMFEGAKLSTSNYDALLGNLAIQAPSIGATYLDAGESTYGAGAGQQAHDTLTDTYGWTIVDGGPAP